MIASVVSTDEDEQDTTSNIPKNADNSNYGKPVLFDDLDEFMKS